MLGNQLWACPACGAMNVAADTACFHCGQPRAPGMPASAQPIASPASVTAAPLEPGVIPPVAGVKKGRRYYILGIFISIGGAVPIILSQFAYEVTWAFMTLNILGFATFLFGEVCIAGGYIVALRAAASHPLAVAKRHLGITAFLCFVGLLIFVPDPDWASRGFLASVAGACYAAITIAMAWKALTEEGTGTWVLDVGIVLALVATILVIVGIVGYMAWVTDLAEKYAALP